MYIQLSTYSGNVYRSSGDVVLVYDSWNDYSFVTMFSVFIRTNNGKYDDVGKVRIGFIGQTEEVSTYDEMDDLRVYDSADGLPEKFFSLGSKEYYRNLAALEKSQRVQILNALNDLVNKPSLIDKIESEEVFSTSLLREASISQIEGQLAKILAGRAELTNFEFRYFYQHEGGNEIDLEFEVVARSKPSSNIHAIIGRNGVGKTTILNSMLSNITGTSLDCGEFHCGSDFEDIHLYRYFHGLVSVAFSAFDPFVPPKDKPNSAKSPKYFYLGLKDRNRDGYLLKLPDLYEEISRSLLNVAREPKKLVRWKKCIEILGSDENFARANLVRLADDLNVALDLAHDLGEDKGSVGNSHCRKLDEAFSSLSSGHFIVLATITKLVEKADEKTLVLLDEPESHLHPPLLSSFIRSLGYLLNEINGVAIIATHSPVVLQEVPRKCVQKLQRFGDITTIEQPEIETFGENVGVLTREVFGLEVQKSGFHATLAESVNKGQDFDEILDEYEDQIGFEGQAVLRALISARDSKK